MKSDSSPAEFTLTNSKDEKVSGNARKGDYFKIHIPAPGPVAGNGFDWVKIYTIKSGIDEATDTEFVAIVVKPAKDPTADKAAAAHFFNRKASSTFVVNRTGKVISAEVHGRNESPNITDTGITDTIRNTFVALGVILGFSHIQWKAL